MLVRTNLEGENVYVSLEALHRQELDNVAVWSDAATGEKFTKVKEVVRERVSSTDKFKKVSVERDNCVSNFILNENDTIIINENVSVLVHNLYEGYSLGKYGVVKKVIAVGYYGYMYSLKTTANSYNVYGSDDNLKYCTSVTLTLSTL